MTRRVKQARGCNFSEIVCQSILPASRPQKRPRPNLHDLDYRSDQAELTCRFRSLTVTCRIQQGQRRMPLGKPLLNVLDRMGYGGLIVNATRQVLQSNNIAVQLLSEQRTSELASCQQAWINVAFENLLQRANTIRSAADIDSWTIVKGVYERGRPLVLRTIPIVEKTANGAHAVVIMIDLAVLPRPELAPLQLIFGLTTAEARLAIAIALGRSPEEIADTTNVSTSTVRRQLSSVFQKTGTHRQPELVALLAHVAILP